MTIQDVWALCREDLRRTESLLWDHLHSSVSLITEVGSYLLQGGGKRLRPLLVILSARLCGYTGSHHLTLASVVELIHNASLLHDDVVDSAEVRRGRAVANSLWGNPASILVGDYLYSKAMNMAVSLQNQRVMDILAETTVIMSEGQVMELASANNLGLPEADYLRIVEAKTAVLMAAACRLGAVLGNAPPAQEKALEAFGRGVGMAFQLTDDLLDYAADAGKLGKSLGKDLAEGRVTLPLIHLLHHGAEEEIAQVRAAFNTGRATPEHLRAICQAMEARRSLEYTLQQAKAYVAQAKEALSAFQNGQLQEALLSLADYVVQREY